MHDRKIEEMLTDTTDTATLAATIIRDHPKIVFHAVERRIKQILHRKQAAARQAEKFAAPLPEGKPLYKVNFSARTIRTIKEGADEIVRKWEDENGPLPVKARRPK